MSLKSKRKHDVVIDDPLDDIKAATVVIGELKESSFEPLGSGFVYVHTPRGFREGESKPDEKGYVYFAAQLWIVTCKHVIEGVDAPAVKFNNKHGGTDVYPIHRRDWWPHQTEDVVVASTPTTKRLGGLPTVEELAYLASEREVGCISHGLSTRRHGFKAMRFHEGTPVSVIGYPTGQIEGGKKDYPVVRAGGHIAQVQGFIDGDPAHRSFLIESSASQGNSGGPVVVPKGTWSPDRNGLLAETVVIGMVSIAVVEELRDETGKLGYRSESLAEVVSMDAVDAAIVQCLTVQRHLRMPRDGRYKQKLHRGGSIMPPNYFFAVDESNRVRYFEWAHRKSGEMNKRVWIEHRTVGSEKDWAEAPEGRYLVVASLVEGEPSGMCDFPVFSTSDDELVLREFLHAMSPVVTAAGSAPGT